MAWWSLRKSKPEALISISDPALAALFGLGNPNFSGVAVGESTALGLSAVYRAVSLISGTLAGLPLHTMRETPEGTRERAKSFLDDPGQVAGMTAFEWRETVLAHLLIHGNCFLAHVFGGAGQVAGLVPIHPLAVAIDPPPRQADDDPLTPTRTYTATLPEGQRITFTPSNFLAHSGSEAMKTGRALTNPQPASIAAWA